MPVPDSTPSAPPPPDFIPIPGPFGHPVLVHRAMAEQSAASGMPVLLAIPADAVRLALAGKSADPRERFSPTDALIAEYIDDHAPCNAAEIAHALTKAGNVIDPGGVRDRFRKDLPLRAARYRSKPGKGYVGPAE